MLYGCCLEGFKFGLEDPDLIVAVGNGGFLSGVGVSDLCRDNVKKCLVTLVDKSDLFPKFDDGTAALCKFY